MLVKLRSRCFRRSLISFFMMPSATAFLMASRIVVSPAPERSTISRSERTHRPRRAQSMAMTVRTACSAVVKRFARLGGIRPHAAVSLRLSRHFSGVPVRLRRGAPMKRA
jgi:hypothetical protein